MEMSTNLSLWVSSRSEDFGSFFMNFVCASYSLNFLISFLKDSKLSAIFSLAYTRTFKILARLANISVLMVSPRYALQGWMFASNLVFELPPKESLRKKVSFESLNGIYFFFFADSTNEFMTLPRVCRLLFILQPSLSL